MTTTLVTITPVISTPAVSISTAGQVPAVTVGLPLVAASIVVRQVEAGATGAPGVGIGTRAIVASEALAAGDLVNVWNNAGTPNVRLASALAKGKDANGFVLTAVSAGQVATVNFGGANTAVTGLTAGPLWLSATSPGKASSTPASGSGRVVQKVGFAYSPTEFMFQRDFPITLSL